MLLLLAATLAVALLTGRELFYNLTYLLTALLVVTFLWAQVSIRWISLGRQTRSRRAQVNTLLEERFLLRNTGPFPKLWLEVQDHSTLPGHYASQVVNSLGPHQERRWRVQTLCRERGLFTLGPITLSSGDPFGLFTFRRTLPHTTSVVIYPMTVEIREFPLPLGHLPGGEALRRRTHTITPNAAGVRDYAPGDSFNRIHWPSTARKDRLIVKEFELDPLSDVWIFLDMDRYAHAALPAAWEQRERDRGWLLPWEVPDSFQLPPSSEEYAVSAAASIAQYFLRRGRGVGLVAYGQKREVLQADRGERQLTKVLEILAMLRAEGRIPFSEVLRTEAARLTRGTTLVAISPSVSSEWMLMARHAQRTGLRVVAVVVDAASFGGPPGAPEIAEQFAAVGIPVRIVREGDDLGMVLGA